MIFQNAKILESVLLVELYVAVMFSCRTLSRSAKVSCRTPHLAEPKALNLEKDYLAEPWNAGSFRVCPIKTSLKRFCDTIATSIARYERYRCWASKVARCCAPCAPIAALMCLPCLCCELCCLMCCAGKPEIVPGHAPFLITSLPIYGPAGGNHWEQTV